MKKKIGIVKRMSCLLLIFLLSINSFAAIVSDNDGSAFITKAEFDALKSSFQSQIDSYNQSIDSKIDGAIASYLSGIKLSSETEQPLLYPISSAPGSGITQFLSVEKGALAKKRKFFNSLKTNDILNLSQSFAGSGATPLHVTITGVDDGGSNYFSFIQGIFEKEGDMECFVTYAEPSMSDVVKTYNRKDLIVTNVASVLARYYFGQDYNNVIWDQPEKWAAETLEFNKTYTNMVTWNGTLETGSNINGATHEEFIKGEGMDSPKAFVEGCTTWTWSDTINKSAGTDWKSASTRKKSVLDIPSSSWKVYFNTSYNKQRSEVRSFLHLPSNADTNIYLFNECDEEIFVYNEADTHLEPFADYNAEPSNCGLTASDVAITGIINKLMYVQGISPQVILHYVPKLRIKQEHNALLASADTPYTNLNQLRNGQLTYKDGTGNIHYAKYYGGLPLFLSSVNSPARCTLDIKIDPTTSGYTGNMKVFIKEGEFPNKFDVTSWSADEKLKLLKLKEGTYTRDTDGGLIIPSGTQVTIEFEDMPQKGKVYFLKFCESGKSYGGQLAYLNNCKMTVAN